MRAYLQRLIQLEPFSFIPAMNALASGYGISAHQGFTMKLGAIRMYMPDIQKERGDTLVGYPLSVYLLLSC